VVVTIHWGANWGYGVPADQVRFAHRLIDGGISLIHGHSSHHPRRVEVYRGQAIGRAPGAWRERLWPIVGKGIGTRERCDMSAAIECPSRARRHAS
jgi:hypothetical protein